MKTEDYCCTYEQAMEIHKSGVENLSTLFVFGKGPDDIWKLQLNNEYCEESEYCSFIPAYTVAELGILLPSNIKHYYLTSVKYEDGFDISYDYYNEYLNNKSFKAETEAQSRANVLIWLINNKYINPKELKL